MLEMDVGPQKIAKGALMRRDIWERLQVHWLHAQEMLQYCCQLKIIPVLWTRVVHEDNSLGTMGPHVEVLVKHRRKVERTWFSAPQGSSFPPLAHQEHWPHPLTLISKKVHTVEVMGQSQAVEARSQN